MPAAGYQIARKLEKWSEMIGGKVFECGKPLDALYFALEKKFVVLSLVCLKYRYAYLECRTIESK